MVEFTQEKVSVQDLVQGMFVARLDRPWVGTPFPIQGFHIRNYDDIRQLGSLCRYVYIDVIKSRVSLKDIRKRSLKSPPDEPRRMSRIKAGEASYPPTRSLKQEVSAAGSLHDDVARAIEQLMSGLECGKPVQLSSTRKLARRMVDSIVRNPDAAMWIARIRNQDAFLYGHCVRASIWAITFARHLELSRERLENLATGVMLCEVGYTRLPKALSGRLRGMSPAEHELVRQHVAYGVEILKELKGINDEILSVVQMHHERFDGSGYPKGLKGGQIPLLGQIAGIVDVYDILTMPRDDREALSPTVAMTRLHDMIDTEFQQELIEEFIRAIGIYPTGTLVELSTGEIGIITEQNSERRLRPRILLLLDAAHHPLKTPREIDLKTFEKDRDGNPVDILKSLPQGAYGLDLAQFRKGSLSRLFGFGNELLRY